MSIQNVLQSGQLPVIAILRGLTPADAAGIGEGLLDGGIQTSGASGIGVGGSLYKAGDTPQRVLARASALRDAWQIWQRNSG